MGAGMAASMQGQIVRVFRCAYLYRAIKLKGLSVYRSFVWQSTDITNLIFLITEPYLLILLASSYQ